MARVTGTPFLRAKLAVPTSERLWYVRYALKMGWSIDQVHQLTKYDPWFIGQMQELVTFEDRLSGGLTKELLFEAKQLGYSDVQLGAAVNRGVVGDQHDIRTLRRMSRISPVYKLVDTCAAEFEAATPYYYSTVRIVIRPSRRTRER